MISVICPASAFGNKTPLLLHAEGGHRSVDLLCANFNAFAFDFIARQKLHAQTLNLFIVEQLPVVPRSGYSRRFGEKTAEEIIRDHVLRLTYTAHDMAAFARDMGYVNDAGEVLLPIVWNERDRRHWRARLDALYFHLCGVADEADVRDILATVPIVEEKDRKAHKCYLTAELIVWYMRALAAGDADAVAPEEVLVRQALPAPAGGA